MTESKAAVTSEEHRGAAGGPRAGLVRWQLAAALTNIPQAAVPIAFGLLLLPLTGSAESGAALVFAMTGAQVLGASPVARLGRRFDAVRYVRFLLAARTAALIAVAILAAFAAPMPLLMGAAACAGFVNGAAFGFLRSLLNGLVTPSGLPRALGVGATLGEIVFAGAPVLAALLGGIFPVWSLVIITLLGAAPIALVPRVHVVAEGEEEHAQASSWRRVPRSTFLWLGTVVAAGMAVASVEVGAVAFAVRYALAPQWAFLFATALCLGSITGGLWVVARNRTPSALKIAAYLSTMFAALLVIVLQGHLVLTLIAALAIGLVLPMLSTGCSLAIDRLAPQQMRAELFAHLRTANALGVLAVAGLLSVLGLQAATLAAIVLVGLLVTAMALLGLRERRRRD